MPTLLTLARFVSHLGEDKEGLNRKLALASVWGLAVACCLVPGYTLQC